MLESEKREDRKRHCKNFAFQRLCGIPKDENCALLGYFAASSGNSVPTFRDNLSVLSRGNSVPNFRDNLSVPSCGNSVPTFRDNLSVPSSRVKNPR